jgi:hypothetical protein
MRTTNPRFPGAPAWMSDGRLFTDYRANCSLLGSVSNASFDLKQRLQKTGSLLMNTDRSLTSMRAASTGCVDTMVPELSKRVCTWDGCTTLGAQPVGIGQGRLYLPGRPDLAAADPDVVAAATARVPGTFDVSVQVPMNPQRSSVGPMRPNRYSAPYGP